MTKIKEIKPDVDISLTRIVTKGDRDRRTQLEHLGEVGVFVKELEEALLDGRIDLAVHSLKDMPARIPQGLYLAAVTERLDPRDVLVSRGKRLAEFAPGACIGTGSLRRAVQITAYRPDLKPCPIRGNVDTRLRKVADGELEGVIAAAAALRRLGWEDKITEYLPVAHFLPAVGQGALAIEVRSNDKEIAEILSPLNHLPTWQSITAERAFLSALGGGCRAPIAALGTVTGENLKLEGMVAQADGQKIIRSSVVGSATAPEELGKQLAQKLLDLGAAELMAEAKR